jgi:TM2 domain-containing membrane protein YozV
MVHDILSPAGLTVGGDARAMMMFETNKKSLAVSYALWFLLGLLGGHRFYNRKFASAILQMISTLFGLLLTLVIVGWFFIIVIRDLGTDRWVPDPRMGQEIQLKTR